MQSRYDSITAAKTWNGASIPPNQELLIPINGIFTRWRFVKGSIASDATEQTAFSPTTNSAVGKWERIDSTIDLKLPWAFNTVDDTALYTVPEGFRLFVIKSVAELTVSLGGLEAASLGIDSSVSTATYCDFEGLFSAPAFIGEEGASEEDPLECVLQAGDSLKHRVLVAGYDAGAGFWHVTCSLLQL